MKEDDGVELTTAERIAEQSPVAASLWRLAEGCRIVGYSVAVLGPLVIAVTWVTEALKSEVSPEEFPDSFKEWYFYVALAVTNSVVGWGTARISEKVEARLEMRFLKGIGGPDRRRTKR